MTTSLVLELTILVLAIFLGFEVISKVPTMLHTPLMSGTNAIHGIVLLGALLILGDVDSFILQLLGFIAVVLGSANVFGGFVVTDRMLEMFRKKPGQAGQAGGAGQPPGLTMLDRVRNGLRGKPSTGQAG